MKFLSPPLVGESRGSLGGITASRNRFGAYLRAKVSPVQPTSNRRTTIRGNFANLCESFRDLSSAEISAWTAFSDTLTYIDSLGRNYTPTAINAYVAVNALRKDLGQAIQTTAPTKSGFIPFPAGFAFGLIAGNNGVTVTFTAEDVGLNVTGSGLLVQIGKKLTESQKFFKGPFVKIGQIVGDSETPPTSPRNLSDSITRNEVEIYYVRARFIDEDGNFSIPLTGRYTVIEA